MQPARFSPIPAPAGTGEANIQRWEVDRGRYAVPMGGVGSYAPGPVPTLNPTTQPFTAQPGPVYRTKLNPSQAYRATAGLAVQITTPPMPQISRMQGGNQSGGVVAQNTVRRQMAALLAMRQRLAQQSGKSSSTRTYWGGPR